MNQGYYVCSIGQSETDYVEENLKRCVLNSCFVLHETASQKGAIKDIKPNDILILKYQQRIIGYGKASGSLIIEDNESLEGWNWKVPVHHWIIGKSTSITGIKDAQEYGSNFATVRKVSNDFALAKMSDVGLVF